MKQTLFILLMVATTVCGCGARRASSGTKAPESAPKREVVKRYNYQVVAELPHSTSAYTQGFEWHEGYLYEGTGGHGTSTLSKVNPASGEALQSISLERRYFGEGITILNGRIWQLTWTSGKAFCYDLGSLRKMAEYSYSGEGWGLTTDGEWLYMSDGTAQIEVRDPKNFEVVRTIDVKLSGKPLRMLNELEWIGGEIWANVYLTDEIVRINPTTGAVVGIIDLSGLQAPEDQFFNTDVLNGIAYDKATGRIFVTGKNWNKIYQIELSENGN